jgi:hypothetical protein
VVFASTTPSTCSVTGTTLTLVTAGTCIIDAMQPGNGIYAAALTVSRVITISFASQTITFTSPGNQTLGTTPAALVATSTSGLTVTLASTTPSTCSVSGTTLTLVGVGTCIIDASQAGNAVYAAATTVSRVFTIAAAPIELFANGGFETVGADPPPAFAWLSAASGYTRSTDAHSGTFSAQLRSLPLSAAVVLQNSKDQGGRPDLVAGSTPRLTFWAKGFAGTTGNVLFALRYLDGVGNIKAQSGNQFFQASINPNTWTQITYTGPAVPVGATAAFIEFSQAIGPIDGITLLEGIVLIDDVSLQVP